MGYQQAVRYYDLRTAVGLQKLYAFNAA